MKKALFLAVALFVSPGLTHASFDTNLSYGSHGESVTELQDFLTDQGVYTGPISGNFYSLTRTAVKAFQTKVGIIPSAGYWGPLTRAKAQGILAEGTNAETTQAVAETGSAPTVIPTPNTNLGTVNTVMPPTTYTKDTNGNITQVNGVSVTNPNTFEVYQLTYSNFDPTSPTYIYIAGNKNIDNSKSTVNGNPLASPIFNKTTDNKLCYNLQDNGESFIPSRNGQAIIYKCTNPVVYRFPVTLVGGADYPVHLVSVDGDVADMRVKAN